MPRNRRRDASAKPGTTRRTVTYSVEVLYRFVAPLVGILFFLVALFVLLTGLYAPTNSEAFLVRFVLLAGLGLVLCIAMLLIANVSRIRRLFSDLDDED